MTAYFAAIDAMNAEGFQHVPPSQPAAVGDDFPFRFYPGSPWIVRHLLKTASMKRDAAPDRIILSELHPSQFTALRREFVADARVATLHADGLATLGGYLPPVESHGVVLIDPPYERDDEYGKVLAALREGHQRWPRGTYAVWMPILRGRRATATRFMTEIADAMSGSPVIAAELSLADAAGVDARQPGGDVGVVGAGMVGSAMVVVNPPADVQPELLTVLPWLSSFVARGGHHAVTRVTPSGAHADALRAPGPNSRFDAADLPYDGSDDEPAVAAARPPRLRPAAAGAGGRGDTRAKRPLDAQRIRNP